MTFRGGSRPLIWVNVQVAVRRPNFKNPHIPRTFPETPAVAPAKNGLRLQECRMNPTGTTSDVNAAVCAAAPRRLMKKRFWLLAALPAILVAGVACADYPILDKIAEKVIQKYQHATCEQLWQERAEGQGKPKPEEEQRLVKFLHEDPQARAEFFNKVSAPIVNKMFECGMIP